MKSISSKLAVLVAGLALCVGLAAAQEQPEIAAKNHGRHGHFMGGMDLGLPLHQLNLTEDQKAQVKQIFQSEKATMRPLMQQEMTAHQQLIQLVTGGSFDQAKAAAIATQESQTHLQLEVEHAKIASQIYQLLTADQKAKVAEMIAQHQQRMQEHMQHGEQTPPPSE
jgi:periplasmic protein CpxP/Spy